MDVMTPAIEPEDGSDTRWALETARTLWGQGERREALQWIRRAAEAAAEAGQDDRALGLAKAGADLLTALEIPRTLPPPAVAGAPSVVIVPPVAATAVAAPLGAPAQTAAPLEAAVPVRSEALVPPAKPVAHHAVAVSPPVAAPASVVPPPSERGETELVVTLVPSDGSSPSPDAALVSHRAVRVAVLPGGDPTELRVRVLRPGQVAPREAGVSLLVALEPGAPPIPGE